MPFLAPEMALGETKLARGLDGCGEALKPLYGLPRLVYGDNGLLRLGRHSLNDPPCQAFGRVGRLRRWGVGTVLAVPPSLPYRPLAGGSWE